MLEVSARVLVGRVSCNGGRWLPPKVVGKADMGGVWPYLDPMDSVCLRTASMEWNVPGKYGPDGELVFFLIQKEPAMVPGRETFSPFFNADIRTLLFSADVLRKCALVALHVIAEGRDGGACRVPGLGDEWEWVAQRVHCGKVRAKLGRKTKVCLLMAPGKAMCTTMRCTSSGSTGLVTRSLVSWWTGSWQRWL